MYEERTTAVPSTKQGPDCGRSLGVAAVIALALMEAMLLAVVAPAGAATVREVGVAESRVLVYRAAPGEVNRLTIKSEVFDSEAEHGAISFIGTPVASIRLSTSCKRRGVTVTCDYTEDGPFSSTRAFLGDRSDVVTTEGGAAVFGEAGVDRLTGPEVDGGAGDDHLRGRNLTPRPGGSLEDLADTGGGRDHLTGGLGNDHLDGRAGPDRAHYEGRREPVQIDLRRAAPQGSAGERDTFISIEEVATGSAADTLIGNAAFNVFVSGGGNDTVTVSGGGRDIVFCGPGSDTVRADASDKLVACERVTRVG